MRIVLETIARDTEKAIRHESEMEITLRKGLELREFPKAKVREVYEGKNPEQQQTVTGRPTSFNSGLVTLQNRKGYEERIWYEQIERYEVRK